MGASASKHLCRCAFRIRNGSGSGVRLTLTPLPGPRAVLPSLRHRFRTLKRCYHYVDTAFVCQSGVNFTATPLLKSDVVFREQNTALRGGICVEKSNATSRSGSGVVSCEHRFGARKLCWQNGDTASDIKSGVHVRRTSLLHPEAVPCVTKTPLWDVVSWKRCC